MRDLKATFSAARKTIDRALDILERGRWIMRRPRARAVILAGNSDFDAKFDRFLARSGFTPPRMNEAYARLDETRVVEQEDRHVIHLSTYIDENWDGHLNYDLELAAARAALKDFRAGAMKLFRTSGILELKEAVCEHVAAWGIRARPSEVAIVSRRLETYRLLSEVLIGPTTEFWYPAVSRAKYYGVAERHTRWRRELPVDDLGRPDLSDFMLSRAPKVLMIEPDQASPMGATLSEAERVTLVEEARRAGAFVIEDLYCRLLLTEEPPRPLMSLDPAKDSVILIGGLPMWLNSLGSLSFVIANERIINLLRASGRRDYLLPDVCAQLVAMKLNDLGLIPEMLARFRAFHRAHIEGVDRILREAFGDRFSWRVPAGFGNVWLDLRGVDVERLWRHRRGVDFQPGWFYGEKEPRHLVLRYTVPLPMFEEGVRRLRANIEAL